MIEAPALRVPLREGERVRRALLEEDALRLDLKVRKEGGELLLPLREAASRLGFPVATAAFEEADAPPRRYAEGLGHLPAWAQALLPSSFDVIGDVLLVKVPKELAPWEADIGRAFLDATPRLRTVAHDEGVEGELRTRRLRVIAGDPDTRTEHVEYGVRLRVDPATCYFSPRLATERYRVARQVAPGERVVDLMAGVAPFALVLARHASPARVDAVDLNPAAHAFAVENVALNRAGGVVVPHLADARVWARENPGVAHRVIMNLPHSAHAFLEEALLVLQGEGVWHYHCIRGEEDLGRHLAELAARARDAGRSLRVAGSRVVRAYSPRERHYAVDFHVGPVEDEA